MANFLSLIGLGREILALLRVRNAFGRGTKRRQKSMDVNERPRRLLAPRQARFVAKVLQLRTLSQGLTTA